MEHVKIIGANPAEGRRASDVYPTPPEVTEALLRHQTVWGTIWEPAAGDGDLADVLEKHVNRVIRSDIRTGTDFLTFNAEMAFDWIITNPPFSHAEEFIRKCMTYNKPFALLLKSQFWHAAKRKDLFYEWQPCAVMPLTWRPNFLFKERQKAAPLMDVMWCVWMPDKKNYSMYMPIGRTEK